MSNNELRLREVMVYEMREIAPGKNIVTVEIKTQLKGFGGTIKGIGIKS
jgi:hypothetical protein